MRKPVLATQYDGAPFMDRQQFESASEIMFESRIDGLRIVFGFQLSFINANQFLPFARLFPETVVADSVKPRRKTRFATEAAEVPISPKKRFLREIVCQRDIAPDQVAEQTSHTRLVIPDQLRERVVVVIK